MLRVITLKEYLESTIDTAPITLWLSGVLPTGEEVFIDVSPDCTADMLGVLNREKDRIIEGLEMDEIFEVGEDYDDEDGIG